MKKVILFFLCAVTVVFTSCQNFMNGSELKAKLILESKPVVEINLHADVGTVEPSGPQKVKLENPFTIIATTDNDQMYFKEWRCNGSSLDPDSYGYQKSVGAEYIYIEDWSNPKTEIKILKEGKNLEISPHYIKRPQVVSAWPVNSAAGVVYDEDIKVVFDQQIKSESIIWTKEDYNDFVSELKEKNGLVPKTTYWEFVCWIDSNHEYLETDWKSKTFSYETDAKEIYGYVRRSKYQPEKIELIYKNINISNLVGRDIAGQNETDYENIAFHYGRPYLTNHYSTLIIPINEENPPEKYSEVLVTISPFTDSYGAPAKNDYSWSYYINGEEPPAKSDTTPPVIESCNLTFDKGKDDGDSYRNYTDYPCLEVSANDYQSGIRSVIVTYEKVMNRDGTPVNPAVKIAEYEPEKTLYARNYKVEINDKLKTPSVSGYFKAYLTVTNRNNMSEKVYLKENGTEVIFRGHNKIPEIKNFNLSQGQMLQDSYAEKVLAEIPALKAENADEYKRNKYLISVTNKIDCSFSVEDYEKIDYVKYGIKKVYSLDTSKKVSPFSPSEEDLGLTVLCENYNNEKYDFNGSLSLSGYNLTSGIYQLYYKAKDGLGNEDTSEKFYDNEYFICVGIEQYYNDLTEALINDKTPPELTVSGYTKINADGSESALGKTKMLSPEKNSTKVSVSDDTKKALYCKDGKIIITGVMKDTESGVKGLSVYLRKCCTENNGSYNTRYTLSELSTYVSNSENRSESELMEMIGGPEISPLPYVDITVNNKNEFSATFDLSNLDDGIYMVYGFYAYDRSGNVSDIVLTKEIEELVKAVNTPNYLAVEFPYILIDEK